MAKKCGCYCKIHDPIGASAAQKAIARLNERGWYTTTQVSEQTGIGLYTLIILLDTGAFGMRKTKGGHRRVPAWGVAALRKVDLDQYLALTGLTVRGLPPRLARAA